MWSGVLALWFLGCAAPPERPSVLLITLDTTRADHLATYGYFRDTTPTLDALARRSIVFEDAAAPMATTLPSHLSMLTGTWPLEHGVLSNVEHGGRRFVPSPELRSLAELFADAGYDTAAFVSAAPVRSGTGVEAGFQTFDEPRRMVRSARRTTDAALPWLRKHKKKPFFVWIHFFDPHGPFEPEAPHDEAFTADADLDRWLSTRDIGESAERPGGDQLVVREAIDAYDGELRAIDAAVARLQHRGQERGWWDRTVVVVAGDHGEGLGQHGVAGHGVVWREQLQVPWLMHVPWMRGERVRGAVSLVDLAPTLLSVVAVDGAPAWLQQVSGRNALQRQDRARLGLSSLRQLQYLDQTEVSLDVAGWRYVHSSGVAHLFRVADDPHELSDLCGLLPAHCVLLGDVAAALQSQQAERGAALGAGETEALTEAELEALRALGYLDE